MKNFGKIGKNNYIVIFISNAADKSVTLSQFPTLPTMSNIVQVITAAENRPKLRNVLFSLAFMIPSAYIIASRGALKSLSNNRPILRFKLLIQDIFCKQNLAIAAKRMEKERFFDEMEAEIQVRLIFAAIRNRMLFAFY